MRNKKTHHSICFVSVLAFVLFIHETYLEFIKCPFARTIQCHLKSFPILHRRLYTENYTTLGTSCKEQHTRTGPLVNKNTQTHVHTIHQKKNVCHCCCWWCSCCEYTMRLMRLTRHGAKRARIKLVVKKHANQVPSMDILNQKLKRYVELNAGECLIRFDEYAACGAILRARESASERKAENLCLRTLCALSALFSQCTL